MAPGSPRFADGATQTSPSTADAQTQTDAEVRQAAPGGWWVLHAPTPFPDPNAPMPARVPLWDLRYPFRLARLH